MFIFSDFYTILENLVVFVPCCTLGVQRSIDHSMRASLPLRSFSAFCRGQVRPTLTKSLRTRNTQTAHSTRRLNSSNTSSGNSSWTTTRALALAAVVGAGAYVAASSRSTSLVTVAATAPAKDPIYGDITLFEKVRSPFYRFLCNIGIRLTTPGNCRASG